MVGSTAFLPFAWGTPDFISLVMSVLALPISIWPQAMSYLRPSNAVDLVRPVIACFVAVYGAEFGRGAWAEIEPLLMIRPPRGRWVFISRKASWVHRKTPVRLTRTTWFHSAWVNSSRSRPLPNMPELLNTGSIRHN